MTAKPLIHSYTSLNCFVNICPHQYYRRYIKRDLPFVETPAMKHGNAVHSAMEQRIAGGKPLPLDMNHWEPLAEPFARRGAKAEMKLAVDYQYKPVDYWDKERAFIRGKADVVMLNNSHAFLGDWKTGKPYERPFELEVQAMLLKASYPNLQTIIGTYIWLKDCGVGKTHDVSDVSRTFSKCVTIIKEINTALQIHPDNEPFEKRQSGLCGFCDVTDCEYNRKK